MRSRLGAHRLVAAGAIGALALVAGCGGSDYSADRATSTTTPGVTVSSTVPTYPPITTGSFEGAGRLACIGGVETFEVTSAPIGSTLRTFPSADAAVAAEIADDADAETAAVVGDEERGTRYVLYDDEETAVEEVVVGDTPDGKRVVLHDNCG